MIGIVFLYEIKGFHIPIMWEQELEYRCMYNNAYKMYKSYWRLSWIRNHINLPTSCEVKTHQTKKKKHSDLPSRSLT